MKRIKTENIPLISIVAILLVLSITVIVSQVNKQTLNLSSDKNYQVTGMVDNSRFTIERAYYKDNNLVIESNISTTSDGSIQNKSIYYKLGVDSNSEVISQGFLTKKISIPKAKISTLGNILIQIYGVSDVSEVESSEILYQIVIDRDEIIGYVDVLSSLRNYKHLDNQDKTKLINFIDLNYVNDRLISLYNSDIQKILKPYLKADKTNKQVVLEKIIEQVTEKYNYYQDLGNLININFAELVKNSIAIEDNYTYTAIKQSINYIDEKMVEEVNKLKVQLIDENINIEEFEAIKENLPLKNQYEYLQEQIKKVT